jgi:hypothetical protein
MIDGRNVSQVKMHSILDAKTGVRIMTYDRAALGQSDADPSATALRMRSRPWNDC